MTVMSPIPSGEHPSSEVPQTAPAVEPAGPDGGGPPIPGRSLRGPVAATVVLALVAVAAGVFAVTGGDSDDPAVATEPLRAVEAARQDLVEFTDLDGTLGWATSRAVTAGREGVVTGVAGDGDTLRQGETAFEVNTVPVVVMYGETPLYRVLSEGAEGDDVLVLEQNLASLGYHATTDDDGEEIDEGLVVDGVFDTATTAAVIRWQEDLGVATTGTVSPADVIVVAGSVRVSDVRVEAFDQVQGQSPVLTLNVQSTADTFHSPVPGEVEMVAAAGPVTDGQVLYTVGDVPVVAVVADDLVFDRTLFEGVDDGDDVEALERTLVALGYDADGDLDVDTEFDDATTEAVEDWQDDLADEWDDAVAADGVVEPADLVVVAPDTVIGELPDREATVLATGAELFRNETIDTSRIVTTAIAVSDQDRLVEGQEVDVEFPDGSIVTGVVVDVATSSTVDPTAADADPSLAVELALSSVPGSAAGLDELDVEVKLVDELVEGAVVVPVSALVSTGDGGFAVEVVQGASTVFVAVEPGMFTDGLVEVQGIDAGTAVVVPR